MNIINWGIIGCGNVTEVKSGPAFNKVPDSALVAVMRRDGAKAKDYARRHQVPHWYADADRLINDPLVNAIYIATPPDTHEMYAVAAMNAGKPVYVEKPMALTYVAAKKMAALAEATHVKLTVAHYRRQLPLFKKIKQLIDSNVIGDIRLIKLELLQTPSPNEGKENNWRFNPAISGGGLFYDLAPHQLDLLYYFFGAAKTIKGVSQNHTGLYPVNDMVAGTMLFKNNMVFSGAWCFNATYKRDYCEIIGSKGKIGFSFFGNNSIGLMSEAGNQKLVFDMLPHVQQPMIAQVVQYFLGKAPNPCNADEGAEILRWMDAFCKLD